MTRPGDNEDDVPVDIVAALAHGFGLDPPTTRADPHQSSEPTPQSFELLPVRPLADLAAEVDARGPRKWLIRGIWPAGDYGVHGAEPKAGKTWNALDLAVSVASGTPWLGAVPVDTTGPVLVFAGEGGAGNIVRRIRAIANARGLRAEDLHIWVCPRAPHLTSLDHQAVLAHWIEQIRPVLVVLDPLYLSARGSNGADIYAMGAVLEAPQRICQDAGSALFLVTHYNRSRDLKGAARLTGAGPAEWGRVLLAAAVITRHTDPLTKATTVLVELDVTGGEIPDQTLRIRRTIAAVDPDDLDSALTYRVDILEGDDSAARLFRLTGFMERISKVLEGSAGATSFRGVDKLVSGSKDHIARALDTLVTENYVIRVDGPNRSKMHTSVREYRQAVDPLSDRYAGNTEPPECPENVCAVFRSLGKGEREHTPECPGGTLPEHSGTPGTLVLCSLCHTQETPVGRGICSTCDDRTRAS